MAPSRHPPDVLTSLEARFHVAYRAKAPSGGATSGAQKCSRNVGPRIGEFPRISGNVTFSFYAKSTSFRHIWGNPPKQAKSPLSGVPGILPRDYPSAGHSAGTRWNPGDGTPVWHQLPYKGISPYIAWRCTTSGSSTPRWDLPGGSAQYVPY